MAWDPNADLPPGLVIGQPGRPPVIVTGPEPRVYRYVMPVVCGRQEECACACGPVAPGVYATEINVHNPHDHEARIRKLVIPLVLAGAVVGREPRTAGRRGEDRILLPPHAAVMDDCCRLAELLLGAPPAGPAPITLGVLEIVSTVELAVTAVYTVTGLSGSQTSIDVQQVRPSGGGGPP